MADSIWNGLCKQPVITASTEKYSKLVYDSTSQLNEPIDSILSALNLRAIALLKCANFESALRDAKVMQQLSTSSALGYVHEASIYNEQGKRRQAIDICNTGLDIVDTNDPDYATLQRLKHDAEHHSSKRIDFIKQLPIEIVTTTLVPLLVEDSPLPSSIPCPYLHVSNLWRDCILQCLDGLSFKTRYLDWNDDMETCWQLILFSRYIKALHVDGWSDGLWLYDLFGDNDFNSLRELYIHCYFTISVDDFVALLEAITNTLAHLTIRESYDKTIPLREILSACPNLTSLTMSQRNVHDFSSYPMSTWPNMANLSIEYTKGELTRDHIISLCKRFPALRNLHLYPCQDLESALWIPRYCPLLTSVSLKIHPPHVGVTYTNGSAGCEQLAMTKISIYLEEDWEEEDGNLVDVDTILWQHHETLEDIEWNIHPEIDIGDIYRMQYPRLKKLSLCTAASWMIRNAPILEDLTMTSIAISTDSRMLDTPPPRLKKLEMKVDDDEDLVHEKDIERYLQLVSQQCVLHELAIHFADSEMSSAALAGICSLNTLQRLMIGFRCEWDQFQMEWFLDALVDKCPYISCLEIKCTNAPSTYCIDALKELGYLRQFAFSIRGTEGYASFWLAIQTFQQLKHIRIYPAIENTPVEIERLRQQRRDMTIISDRKFQRF